MLLKQTLAIWAVDGDLGDFHNSQSLFDSAENHQEQFHTRKQVRDILIFGNKPVGFVKHHFRSLLINAPRFSDIGFESAVQFPARINYDRAPPPLPKSKP